MLAWARRQGTPPPEACKLWQLAKWEQQGLVRPSASGQSVFPSLYCQPQGMLGWQSLCLPDFLRLSCPSNVRTLEISIAQY